MKNIRKTKLYKEMSLYNACSVAEGFCDGEPTQEELQTSWQWLVDTGHCWKLQGFYGRTATDLIEDGFIKPAGKDTIDYYGHVVKGKK